ncbi:MAG: zinc-dependent alcohol dehydrogenase family protein [Candidatus Latescibacterota bacterium]|jgi:alcohol dehydrogenase
MKAVLMEQFQGPLVVTQVPDPIPPEDGVVIEVRANGICRSDWHAWMGHDPTVPLPHVPGHELAGVVAAVGPAVRQWQAGDRVTVPFCCGCGVCPECRAGHHQVCPHQFQPGFSAWGSFAQRVAIPFADANLVRLPEELDFTEAASLGCRFMTSFRGVVDQGRVRAGEWVAVHGCGGVGLSATMIATALGARVVGVDIDPVKLELARTLGATATVRVAPDQDPVPALLEITGGGAQVSIDALGHPATCRNSVRCLARRGRHVQIGLTLAEQSEVPIPMDQVTAKELEILGSHGMPAHRFGDMLGMIVAGRIDPARLIGKRIPLEEAPEELQAMGRFAQHGVTVIDRF